MTKWTLLLTCLGSLSLWSCFKEPEQANNETCRNTELRYCSPDRPNRVLTKDTCGEEGVHVTCSGELRCAEIDGQATCACPLVEPATIACAGEKVDQEAVLGPLDVCGGLREITDTCPFGERCWGVEGDEFYSYCATSIDPRHASSSEYYTRGCDADIYMHAQTNLPADCRCNRSSPGMAICYRHSDAWNAGLRVGSGPHTREINVQQWGGGFLHAGDGELYATVHYTGGGSGKKPGAIYAFDYKTGDRRVVSGSYLEADGRHDVGSGYTVDGEALHHVTDAELGADGMIYAYGTDLHDMAEITRVDRQTGARTLVWRRRTPADEGDAAFAHGQCFSSRDDSAYPGGKDPVRFAERAFAMGPDGAFYIGFKNDGVGIVRISPDGRTCEVISRWASRELPDIGGGFNPQYGTISGMLHYRGQIYFETQSMLFTADPSTGDRVVFSAVSGIGGVGETNFVVDEQRQVLFACGTVDSRKCSVHRLDDGNVAQGLFQIGATQPVLEGAYPQVQGAKGALDHGQHLGFAAFGIDPEDNDVMYFVMISGMLTYEVSTGNSYISSM